MPAEGRENHLLKKGNSDAFFREKYLTKNTDPRDLLLDRADLLDQADLLGLLLDQADPRDLLPDQADLDGPFSPRFP